VVALLVAASPLAARVEACAAGLRQSPPGAKVPAAPRAISAHEGLLALAHGEPEILEVDTPWGGFAKARLFWV
jgi:hypothetical protein